MGVGWEWDRSGVGVGSEWGLGLIRIPRAACVGNAAGVGLDCDTRDAPTRGFSREQGRRISTKLFIVKVLDHCVVVQHTRAWRRIQDTRLASLIIGFASIWHLRYGSLLRLQLGCRRERRLGACPPW